MNRIGWAWNWYKHVSMCLHFVKYLLSPFFSIDITHWYCPVIHTASHICWPRAASFFCHSKWFHQYFFSTWYLSLKFQWSLFLNVFFLYEFFLGYFIVAFVKSCSSLSIFLSSHFPLSLFFHGYINVFLSYQCIFCDFYW